MQRDRPSFTAAWVAACRGLAALLPPEAHIAEDRFGVRFGGRLASAMARVGGIAPGLTSGVVTRMPPLLRSILYLQVRTRAIDDAMLDFVEGGGRQIVILGAGFDCRAARFRDELAAATVFEVDHPATQKRKRAILAEAAEDAGGIGAVRYLAWDFEQQPMSALGTALAAEGHDATAPALFIWEGVTMYLTEDAIDATVAAVRDLAAPGSVLVFTYFERRAFEAPRADSRLIAAFVARVGEPFRFGWDPAALPAWLAARGFELVSDRADHELAAELLPAPFAARVAPRGRHVAIATPRTR
jgi:methyltransferase (TIGR00027 family)